MPITFERRKNIPRILSSLVPAPYALEIEGDEQADFGFFANLYRDGALLKKVELYPYTVVGPGTHRPADERRIELELKRRAHNIRRRPPRGRTGVMVGLRNRDIDGSPATPLLVLFAFGIFKDVTTRSSIQFPKRLLLEAEVLGASAFAKSVTALGMPTRAITLAIQPEIFPFFLTQLADDFQAPQDWDALSVAQIVESAKRYYSVPAELKLDAVAETGSGKAAGDEIRIRAARQITQPIRDWRFAINVRKAYGDRCAACDIQLELIEAAHIDPVENLYSSDDTNNGIALCALHHVAYDTGLIDIFANGLIVVNEERATALDGRLRSGGLSGFRKGLRSTLRMPEDSAHRPSAIHFENRSAFLSRDR